jgi:two-component system, NtrC family, nitrogen regulation sensor histidine kinase NtrY
MVMRNTRRFLLFVALISLGVLLVANFFLTDRNDEEKFIKPITKQIQKIEKEFDDDFLQLLLKNRPDEEFSFTNLTIDSFHPYYLFSESGKLVYWSDFSYMPDFDWINSKTNQRILEDKRGIFFSKARRFSRNNQGYWIIQLYPLYFKRDFQNQYLESGFNSKIFPNDPQSISSVREEGLLEVKGAKGEFLFSVYFDPEQIPIEPSSRLALMIFFFSLFFLVLLMTRNLILSLWTKGKQVKALISASAVLITIRALMLVFRFPKDYFNYRLFDPSGYASSWINPSLGDLFLNIICLAVLLSMVLRIIASKEFKNWLSKRRIKKNSKAFLIVAYLFSTLFLALFYALYIDILSNSQWDLNILSLPSLDWFKVVSLSIVFLGGAGYFCLLFWLWSWCFTKTL